MAENSGALRELLAVFGFSVDTHELKKGESGLESFLGSVKRIAGGIAAAFAVHEIFEFAEANVRAMSEIERAAAQLGTSTDQIQKYQLASRSLGMEADGLTSAMTRMQVAQEASARSTGDQQNGFAMLGVSVKDSAGKMKGVDELFLDVADAISKQTDQTKVAAATVRIFGRAGGQLLPLLKKGKAGFAELTSEFPKLGGGYSEKALEASKDYEGQTAKLSLALTSLKSKVMEALLPILSKLVSWITKGANWFRQMSKDSYLLQAALGTLTAAAGAFAIAMAIANAPILLIAAGIAALILVIDDIITMFEGGESLIGDTIDKIFGKDAHLEVVEGIKTAWEGVGQAFTFLNAEIKPIWDFFKWSKENLGDIGEKIGDTVGKAQNFVVSQTGVNPATGEITPGIGKKGVSGLPKYMQAAAFAVGTLENVQAAPNVLNGKFLQPQLPEGNSAAVNIDQVHVNLTAPAGADPEKFGAAAGEAFGKKVNEVLKRNRRAAAATLQRKPSQ